MSVKRSGYLLMNKNQLGNWKHSFNEFQQDLFFTLRVVAENNDANVYDTHKLNLQILGN